METQLINITGVKVFLKYQCKFQFHKGQHQNKWKSKYCQNIYWSKSKDRMWQLSMESYKRRLRLMSHFGILRIRSISILHLKKRMKLFGNQSLWEIRKLILKKLIILKILKTLIWKLKAILRKCFMNKKEKNKGFQLLRRNNSRNWCNQF